MVLILPLPGPEATTTQDSSRSCLHPRAWQREACLHCQPSRVTTSEAHNPPEEKQSSALRNVPAARLNQEGLSKKGPVCHRSPGSPEIDWDKLWKVVPTSNRNHADSMSQPPGFAKPTESSKKKSRDRSSQHGSQLVLERCDDVPGVATQCVLIQLLLVATPILHWLHLLEEWMLRIQTFDPTYL